MENTYPYQAHYCEENIWHLAQHFLTSKVVFILNYGPCTRLYYQKAASHPLLPVHWDYHVILINDEAQALVYDFDTYLGFPLSTEIYFKATFNLAIEQVDPNCVLRIIDAVDYQQCFYSDRLHMKDENGNWFQPPPAWELIKSQSSSPYFLKSILDVNNTAIGRLVMLSDWLVDKV